MTTTNSIASLGASLDEFYLGTDKQIVIALSDKPYTFHVVLRGRDNEPDCKISSWSANLWARTSNGMNRQRYSSLQTLQRALVNLVNKKVNTQGEITFQISTEVHSM